MPGRDLPINNDTMVQGLDYTSYPVPDNDACSTEGGNQNGVLGAANSLPCPLQPVSLATQTIEGPPLGARQVTTLHKDGWLDYDKPAMGTPES